MHAERTDVVADRLTGQIADLSESLARAGVSLEEHARLLEVAAVAAVKAVCLQPAPPSRVQPAPVTPIAEAPSLREATAPSVDVPATTSLQASSSTGRRYGSAGAR